MKLVKVAVVISALILTGCGEELGEKMLEIGSKTAPSSTAQPVQPAPVVMPAERVVDMARIARGGRLYQANCAQCHGKNGEGAPSWQKQTPDGKYLPPPLNGTGHAWHHPQAALMRTIRGGTMKIGGSMPAWKDKLTDVEIADIIVWFQSRWPNELYTAWSQMDVRARAKAVKR